METTAAYELLKVDGKGQVRQSAPGDGRCFVEAMGTRITSAPGLNAGVATFRGGALPAEGLRVLPENVATSPAVFHAAGWSGGELLHFEASGFSMPALDDVGLEAPHARLGLRSPALDDATTLHVSRTEPFHLEWAPIADTVLARLRTTKGADEQTLYCFFDGPKGEGTFDAGGIAQLPDVDGVGVKGVFDVTLHAEKATIVDDWNIIVIADSMQGRRAFVTSW